MRTVYVDGHFLPWDRAMLPVDDLAVIRGYAALDIMRTFDGKPFSLDEHLGRLFQSCKKIGLDPPWSSEDIKDIVLEVLEKNDEPGEKNVRIIVTAGASPDFFTPGDSPRLIVMATPMARFPREWYENGIKVITVFEERPIPEAKLTAYIPAAMAMKKAKACGASEAIYIGSGHQALECTGSNLFAVKNATLITPDHGVLKGITRKAILTIAEKIMEVKERLLPLEELLLADEVFITGTSKGVVPVTRIDDTIIKNGKPGPWTLKLMQTLNQHASQLTSATGTVAG